MLTRKLLLILLVSFATFNGYYSYAQTTPFIKILSPANETIVKPGQSLPISVTSFGVPEVAIVGTNQIGQTALQAGGTSLQFSLAVPTTIRPGRYFLTAVGGSGGNLIQSSSVSVIVQNPRISTQNPGVSALRASPTMMTLFAPGNQNVIDVDGKTANGLVRMFPEGLTFSSANPVVASVDARGVVTGQSPGQTQVEASYSDESETLSTSTAITVGGAVRGDLNNDGQIDIEDINILQTSLNIKANGPNDARDLNHDGKIDALDAGILVTLCTYPRCATHP